MSRPLRHLDRRLVFFSFMLAFAIPIYGFDDVVLLAVAAGLVWAVSGAGFAFTMIALGFILDFQMIQAISAFASSQIPVFYVFYYWPWLAVLSFVVWPGLFVLSIVLISYTVSRITASKILPRIPGYAKCRPKVKPGRTDYRIGILKLRFVCRVKRYVRKNPLRGLALIYGVAGAGLTVIGIYTTGLSLMAYFAVFFTISILLEREETRDKHYNEGRAFRDFMYYVDHFRETIDAPYTKYVKAPDGWSKKEVFRHSLDWWT